MPVTSNKFAGKTPPAPLVSLAMLEDTLRDEVFPVVDPIRRGEAPKSGSAIIDLLTKADPYARAYRGCVEFLAEVRRKGDPTGATKVKTPDGRMMTIAEIAAEAEGLRATDVYGLNLLFSTQAATVEEFQLKMIAAIGCLTPDFINLQTDAGITQEPFPAAFFVLTTLCDVIRLFVTKTPTANDAPARH